MLLLLCSLLLAVLRGALGSGVIELELYRAVKSQDIQMSLENVDLASLSGVLSWVQTEVVGEHFPQDHIPGKAPLRPAGKQDGSGIDEDDDEAGGGFGPLGAEGPQGEEDAWTAGVDMDAPEVGLVDANDMELEWDHPDELDPAAELAGSVPHSTAAVAFLAAPKDPADGTSSRRRVRTERHRGVDVIFRTDFKVKNPPAMLASRQVSCVDFGPEVFFENGEAQGRGYKWDYGDFVGAAKHVDLRVPQMIPGYWFSLSGSCPNVPWEDKHKDGEPPDDMNPKCMVHPSGVGHLRGGLCGTDSSAVPTGEIGCTYTYRRPIPGSQDVVKLDDISGITKEDCGGRLCRDWRDFRESCTNEEYKKVFNYGRRRTLTKSKYCIEYDIHPACVNSCSSKQCKALKDADKDLGLPFWRGRCTALANLNRTEQLAVAFNIPGASDQHATLDPKVLENAETCLSANHSDLCRPHPGYGFMYCTRQWSGVCQACYIPGGLKLLPDASKQIMCPWNVLQLQDYSTSEPPKCRTTAARDFCCLYSGTCNITVPADALAAAEAVPLDEDGYTAMTAAQNTEAMKSFLYRYHHELFGGELADEQGLNDLSYWEWGTFPQLGHSFARAVRLSRPFFVYPTTTTSTTGTTSATRTWTGTTPPPTTSVALTEPPEVRSRGAVGSSPWLGLAVALLCAGLLSR